MSGTSPAVRLRRAVPAIHPCGPPDRWLDYHPRSWCLYPVRITLDELKQVNPHCEYAPEGHDEAAFQKLRTKVIAFGEQLTQEFRLPFQVSPETWIQDATYGVEIYLPNPLIIGEDKIIPCIRVSNHRKLYIITVVRRVSPDTEARIEQVAERLGFTYTPEELFGEPFDSRDRINGDLFNQLYDYV